MKRHHFSQNAETVHTYTARNLAAIFVNVNEKIRGGGGRGLRPSKVQGSNFKRAQRTLMSVGSFPFWPISKSAAASAKQATPTPAIAGKESDGAFRPRMTRLVVFVNARKKNPGLPLC